MSTHAHATDDGARASPLAARGGRGGVQRDSRARGGVVVAASICVSGEAVRLADWAELTHVSSGWECHIAHTRSSGGAASRLFVWLYAGRVQSGTQKCNKHREIYFGASMT